MIFIDMKSQKKEVKKLQKLAGLLKENIYKDESISNEPVEEARDSVNSIMGKVDWGYVANEASGEFYTYLGEKLGKQMNTLDPRELRDLFRNVKKEAWKEGYDEAKSSNKKSSMKEEVEYDDSSVSEDPNEVLAMLEPNELADAIDLYLENFRTNGDIPNKAINALDKVTVTSEPFLVALNDLGNKLKAKSTYKK